MLTLAGCGALERNLVKTMRVLLAIDESPYAADAVAAVARQDWSPGTTMRVLTVVEERIEPGTELWYSMGGHVERIRREMIRRAYLLVTCARQRLCACGHTVEAVVRGGDPRAVIINEAKAWPADLIIIGVRDFTAIERWLLGRVARRVISDAPCPVQIVRQNAARQR
jgi:nucleotide-binding universal stress UspA family protein